MRHAVMILVMLLGGCSLLWSMSDYDAKPRASGDAGNASSDGGSSGASTSGSTSSGADGEAGADGAIDPNDCPPAPEPNDSLQTAIEVPAGVTCGVIATPGDLDYFTVDGTAGTIDVTVTLREHVQLTVTGGSDPAIHQTPGEYDVVTSGAKRTLLIQSFDGSLGTYVIRRK